MSKFYCIDIEFPGVDFSHYYIESKTGISKIHHAHLYTSQDEIKIIIYYDESSYFGEKLSAWLVNVDLKKFGSYLKVNMTKNHVNEGLKKIDLSKSKLRSLSNSSNYYEGNKKYVVLKIDTVKFYWNPKEENKNTGEFYLDDKGFRVVEPFYGIFGPKTYFKNDGKFEINRLTDSTKFYKLQNSTFRPEFNVYSKDNKKERAATIIKEPKIQFKYQDGITEEEAIFCGDVVLILASFYHHIKIDFTFRRINLTESTITIKNIEQKNYFDTTGNLWGFKIRWGFNKFLQSGWQKGTLKNFELLSKAVALFNQSLLVDNSSAFLIRYNIIEICGKTSSEDKNWNFTLRSNELDNFFNDIKEKIANIIDTTEQKHFNNKWNSIQNIIKSKSLRKQLEDSLVKNDIDVENLPIKASKIVQLRNNIAHGSLNKVNTEDLRKVNILLYRISGIFILNLMGIKEWELNTKIN